MQNSLPLTLRPAILTFDSPPDFENPSDANENNIYVFNVQAYDGNVSTSQQILVTVEDHDASNAPEFTDADDVYAFTIAENATVGAQLGTTTATDGDNDPVTYTLSGGNGKFAINSNTGLITLAQSLDYETNPWHRLTVQASDPFGNADFATVRITVTDIPDAPIFTPDAHTVTIAEDAAVGSAIGTYSANDPNGDALTYSLADDFDTFTVNATTGAITTTAELDKESTSSYTLILIAADPMGNEGSAAINVFVNNVNDEPVFNPPEHDVDLAESAPVGTVVGTYTANDPNGDALTYSLTVDLSAFTVNATTGEITTTAALDCEDWNKGQLTLVATDPSGNPGMATININITDVNDTPVFNPDEYNVNLQENVAAGASLGTFTAIDPNGDALTYALRNDFGKFGVNVTTGQITTSAELNYEQDDDYTLTLVASDPFGNEGEATINVTVQDDPNELNILPNFQFSGDDNDYTFTLGEGLKEGADVGNVSAYDSDGDTLTYSIPAAQNPNGYFRITGTLIELNADLPLDGTMTYQFVVEVSDGHGDSTSADVTVNLKPLVSVTGDNHSVENSGDTITIDFFRITHDTSEDLEVRYEVVWQTAEQSDLQDVSSLTSGTIVIEDGEDQASITLLAVADNIPEGSETFRIQLLDTDDYDIPSYDDAYVEFGDSYGTDRLGVTILDGVALFGANNTSETLRDNNTHGIHLNDIDQGSVGDCFYLAAIGNLAYRRPDLIQDIIQDNGDGTVTVSFYDSVGDTEPTEITVDLTLDFGERQADLSGDTDGNGNFEIWTQILEKAYREYITFAELNDGGSCGLAWEHLTGEDATITDAEIFIWNNLYVQYIKDALDAGAMVTVATSFAGTLSNGTKLVNNHAYIITGYTEDEFTIYNPHGYSKSFHQDGNPYAIPFDQLSDVTYRVYVLDLD